MALVLVSLLAGSLLWRRFASRSDEIEYRGEKIRLSKSYRDFDEYKNDPKNIDPSETERVQALVTKGAIGRTYSTRIDVFQATQTIVFPGYGSSSGEGRTSNGNELLAVAIEIPRAEKDRYLLFMDRNGHYELIDDFVNNPIPAPFGIREESGEYVYYSSGGKEAFRRPAGK